MKTNPVSWRSPAAHRLWWILLAGVVPFVSACRPATATDSVAADPRPYTVYVADGFLGEVFVPVDPATLADRPDGRPLAAPLVSADGAIGVDTEMTAGWGSADPETIWIIVYDLTDGTERARFHPPAAGLVTGLSADGSRLLLQPFPPPHLTYPPPVDYYALDAADGAVVGHVRDAEGACYRQYALFDPAGAGLYCMVDPALRNGAGENSVLDLSQLCIAYYPINRSRAVPADDTAPTEPAAGRAVCATVETEFLPRNSVSVGDVLIGQRGVRGQVELIEPAVALSPDGHTLAVVDAEKDAVTLIDAATLTVEAEFFLQNSASAGTVYAKGFAGGTLRQAVFSADSRYLYVYTHELKMTGDEPPSAERGLWVVDLARRQVAGRALPDYQIQWVLPAPDGSVYAFGATTADLGPYEIRDDSPSMLWRLDGRTLVVLAARSFTGYRGGRLGR